MTHLKKLCFWVRRFPHPLDKMKHDWFCILPFTSVITPKLGQSRVVKITSDFESFVGPNMFLFFSAHFFEKNKLQPWIREYGMKVLVLGGISFTFLIIRHLINVFNSYLSPKDKCPSCRSVITERSNMFGNHRPSRCNLT